MSLRTLIRQAHRWLGILLTVTILANFAAKPFGPTPAAITYAPLVPLALLLISGLYVFILPYRDRRTRIAKR